MALGFYILDKYTAVNLEDIVSVAQIVDDSYLISTRDGNSDLSISKKQAKKLVEFLEQL